MSETGKPQLPHEEDVRLLKETLQLLADQARVQSELMKEQSAQLEATRQQLERQAEELHQTRQELALRDRLLIECHQQLQNELRRRGVVGWVRAVRDRVSGR